MRSAQSDTGRLVRVLLKHPREAFVDAATIEAQWRTLYFAGPPDLPRAVDEYEQFAAVLAAAGAETLYLPKVEDTTLDSIYVRDASIISDRGAILCRMGKPPRAGEPDAQARQFRSLGIPVIGRIDPPGQLEGGDVCWLDRRTLAVGRGYRTNDSGIHQLRTLMGDSIHELIVVPLPHWRGHTDVMHLMSLISPVAPDLAVVYSPLLPVPFRERLLERGMALVEVPDTEFETMGTNVLALSPGRCLMLDGNPRTRTGLERHGIEVLVYQGHEISVKGAGGPTCLTRPLLRDPAPEGTPRQD
jgi:N-dimethylarginine dimethylaminohydrolase